MVYLRSEAEFRVFAFSTATTAGHVTSTTCVSAPDKTKPYKTDQPHNPDWKVRRT